MGGDGNPMDQIVVAVIDSGLDPDHEDSDYSHVLAGARLCLQRGEHPGRHGPRHVCHQPDRGGPRQ